MCVKVVLVEEHQLDADCASATTEMGDKVLFLKASTPLLTALRAYQDLGPTRAPDMRRATLRLVPAA